MNRAATRLELPKILTQLAGHAVLDGTKQSLPLFEPATDIEEARALLNATQEASLLLFELGGGRIEYFPALGDKAERAQKGATLSCSELTDVACLLRSARICYDSVKSFADERIIALREEAERLYFSERLERDIFDKIEGEGLADNASERLFAVRREIVLMQEKIRARLQEYLTGGERKFLQEGLVTVRGERFVIPVKAEYKRSVKGFVHDRSQSGATVFIEPEEVLGMNNELITLRIDEKEEEERILSELSRGVGQLCAQLTADEEILCRIDGFYARAEYAYRLKAVKPLLNRQGVVEIVKGRHPLLDGKTAVPVSVSVGRDYDFLVVSGANAGGKTVTLKMCGLFCLMAACGLFVPAAQGTSLAVFQNIFCDLGDSQSIEENLSTFSSHIVHLKYILEHADENSFVLVDEPGGGTDPEEGQALARAVLETLLKKGCRGIATTHYYTLKEFAFERDRVENACMEFDSEGQRPLYRLKLGAPGSSNALLVCEKLGLDRETLERARGNLSEGARTLERTVRAAEEGRIQAEREIAACAALIKQWEERMEQLGKEEEKFRREREKFLLSSKAEARRIVTERTARAEELLEEIEDIFKRDTLSESDLIRARTLKNAMGREESEEKTVRREKADFTALKEGDAVYVGSLEREGKVLSVRREKGCAEVLAGTMRVRVPQEDLYLAAPKKAEKGVKGAKDGRVQVVRHLNDSAAFSSECNLIGMTALEAEQEAERFLDAAVLHNAEEVRIVHGMGTGKLRACIHAMLKKHPRVESFRLGNYGEGQTGVTVVKLK